MWPDRLSDLGPLALESDALSTALRNPAHHESFKPMLAPYKLHMRVGVSRQLFKEGRFL